MIEIKKATEADLIIIMGVIECARQYMRSKGNDAQWTNGYPSIELMLEEIRKQHCYLCLNEEGVVVGSFCWAVTNDCTYNYIEQGEWINESTYGVIHRLASNGKSKGVAIGAINWCFKQHTNIRVDTHPDNLGMQDILEKLGFIKCGIIYVADGTSRIAYQKIEEN
ncbi:MAG: GNAT family N-acetyltransferase [Phocaeicola sp.]